MTDRAWARVQIVGLTLFALLAAWNVFDAQTAAARYLSTAMVAGLSAAVAWKLHRYHAVR